MITQQKKPRLGQADAWSQCLHEAGVGDAALLAQSRYDTFRRAYEKDGVIYKVVVADRETTGATRANDLAGEFEILRQCSGIRGIPEPVEHRRTEHGEVLVLRKLPGAPLSQLDVGGFRLASMLLKLSGLVFRLSWRGISHNDIKPENVLVSPSGGISLIDFDQATRTSFVVALIQSLLGIRVGKAQVRGSVAFIIAKRLAGNRLSPRAVRFLRRVVRDQDVDLEHALPALPGNASPKLRELLTAWKIAQSSDASSPGKNVAYYSLQFEGIRFPGERPWERRWETLRGITDYSGKKVLELGCNMSLLSCFLLREGGASAALAVDVDKRILEAARIVGSVLDVGPALRSMNFDDEKPWEKELKEFGADIVFALNVLNWVRNKRRLLEFLGSFPELVFEGHDDLDTEMNRLRAAGFDDIRVVTSTERGRQVLHCRKRASATVRTKE